MTRSPYPIDMKKTSLTLVLAAALALTGCTSYEDDAMTEWLRVRNAYPTVIAAHVLSIGDSYRRIEKKGTVGWKTVSGEHIFRERYWRTGDDSVLVLWDTAEGKRACAFARKGKDTCIGPLPGLSVHPADDGVHVLACADRTCKHWTLDKLGATAARRIEAPPEPPPKPGEGDDDEFDDLHVELEGFAPPVTGCVPALVGHLDKVPVASSNCGTFVLSDPIRKLDSSKGVELSKPVSQDPPGVDEAGFPHWY